MTVKAFKLVSGEYIIAEIINGDTSVLILKKPAAIIVQQGEDGRVGVGLQPYTPFATENVTLYRTSLIAEFDADMNLVNEYNRIFGSGIVIANQMPR